MVSNLTGFHCCMKVGQTFAFGNGRLDDKILAELGFEVNMLDLFRGFICLLIFMFRADVM